MKVLVTGHKGFIGSHVYNHLKYECNYGEFVEGMFAAGKFVKNQ